jgi:hypothetical protein
LKHGIELQNSGQSKGAESKPAAYQSKDPYDFKPVNDHLKVLMSTSDKFPRVLDSGDALNEKPGRKFEYNDADFMLAYFGKDNARNANVALGQNEVFGFNESFKKRFPVDKYLHAPALRAKR